MTVTATTSSVLRGTPADERTFRQPMLPVLVALGGGAAISVATLLGLALALLGLFDAHVVAATSVAVGALLAWRLRRAAIRWIDAPAFALLVVAGASMLANGAYASEHIVTDRDPGVYLNVAVSLARQGSLVIDPAADRFGGADVELSTAGNIYYEDDDVVRPQFFHGFAALAATIDGVFGHRIAVRVPALLGALGLLTIGVFLRRLVRPWFATLGVGALAVCLTQVWISRDFYSEALAQPLLWLSVVLIATLADLLDDAPHDQVVSVIAVAAGVAMAALAVTRVEAPLVFPVLVFVVYLLRTHHACAQTAVAVVAPPLIGLGLWVLDFTVVAKPYWYLTGNLVRLAVGSLAFGALVALACTRRVRNAITAFSARNRPRLALCAGFGVVAVFVVGLLRSELFVETRSVSDAGMRMIETVNGLAPEGLRTYAEQSVVWLTWYLGWPAFVLAVFGLAAMTHRAIAIGPKVEHGVLLTAVVPLMLLYLWQPSIYPDQLWAMRRYVAATFPLLAIGVAVVIETLARATARPGTRAVAGGGLWLAAFAGIAATTLPIREINPYDKRLGQIEEVCRALPTGAVVVIDPASALDVVYVAPVRAFCGVPTAALRESSLAAVHHAANEIRRSGGQPVLLSSQPEAFAPLVPVSTFTVVNPRHQGFNLSKPDTLTTDTFTVSVIHL